MKRTDKDLQYKYTMANLKAALKRLWVITLVLVWTAGLAAQSAPTNLEVLTKLYRVSLDSLTRQMPEPVLDMPVLKGETVTFLRSGWIDYWTTVQRNNVQDTTSRRMVIEQFNAEVSYNEQGVRLFGFTRKMKRQIRFHLKGWIEPATGHKADAAFNIRKTWQDEAGTTEISRLEQGPYMFCKGRFQSRSVWTNFFEPALVLLSVGVSIYLFFSVRS